ncbi:aryl-alcohol dehydrogenase [Vararia minispora EC-137]|uniref:Aryl-alcohol dehydrogenase n=1 Tax=Vararia minispora EC-137 TaxID=1314806 RepID=A0ACB8QX37_9AGAM|nr:aryl-alcohol dehydrogenase [Vararia minispora EC-137]
MAPTAPKKMPYVRLGSSGLKVSKIILGMMSYGDPRWNSWVLSEDEAIKHIKAAYDAGIQTFDTSDVYSNGESEIILGKAIKQLGLPRDEIVVMTKLFHAIPKDQTFLIMKQNQYSEIGYHIFDSVKHSLERLQLDYIDLYQCHRFDYETPLEETVALHDIVQAGYVRYIGMSSCWAWQFHVMQNYALTHQLTPFISMQNQHSLIYREEEREMFPTLKYFGVGAIPWSPLARGLLTRSMAEQAKTKREETDFAINLLKVSPGRADITNRVEEIARKKGITMAQVALAWSLSKDFVSAPIVGTTSLKNLEDLIDAVHVTLTEDEIRYLEEPYKPMGAMGFH